MNLKNSETKKIIVFSINIQTLREKIEQKLNFKNAQMFKISLNKIGSSIEFDLFMKLFQIIE
jgi:hypothetical protein